MGLIQKHREVMGGGYRLYYLNTPISGWGYSLVQCLPNTREAQGSIPSIK